MRNIGNTLLWVVGLVLAAVAAWQFYLFVIFRDSQGLLDVQGGKLHLWSAITATVFVCACVFIGILRRINKTEEFHITTV